MKSVETTGKTIEEAILMAVAQLGVLRDQLDIEILDEPIKGFLGIIGGKDARIRASLKKTKGDQVKEFLVNLTSLMNVDARIDIKENEDRIKVNMSGENMGIMIGYRGETLDALQYITNLAVNRSQNDYKRVILDTERYRDKREETLIRLAKRLAQKVRTTRRSIALEPMNPYERRIIHSALQNHPYVTTYSEGDEPYRKVVIVMK